MQNKAIHWPRRFSSLRIRKSSLIIVSSVAVLAIISTGVRTPRLFTTLVHTSNSTSSSAILADGGVINGPIQGAMTPQHSAFIASSNDAASATIGTAWSMATAPSMAQPGSPSTRLVIEQASLDVTTSEVQAAAEKVQTSVAKSGGFVQSEQVSTGKEQSTIWMTIRIPEPDFQSFLKSAQSLGKITNLSQSGRDVTQQVHGLQGNIQELQSEANAYTQLYNKAQTMHDMLQIQQALSHVNAQISDLSSQEHNLNRQVQLATVNLTFQTAAPVTAARVVSPFLNALDQSLHTLGNSALGLVTVFAWLLPWGVLTAVGVWVWSLWLRRRATPKANN